MPPTRPTDDAIALLTAEHAGMRELLGMLMHNTLGDGARDHLIVVVRQKLWIHLQIEEELFYPALAGSAGDFPVVRTAVRKALTELDRYGWNDMDVTPLSRRLLALHEEDTADEEKTVFPHARRVLDQKALVSLGDELRARRQLLRRSGIVRRSGSHAKATPRVDG